MLDTLFTGSRTSQFATQVTFQGRMHGPIRTGGSLNTKLLKELDRTATHTTTEHHISLLLVDKTGNLSWLVGAIIGISDYFHSLNISPFNIDQGEKGAAPEMVGYTAI
jgi:hypothetical protein